MNTEIKKLKRKIDKLTKERDALKRSLQSALSRFREIAAAIRERKPIQYVTDGKLITFDDYASK
jgi:prefoldin subunit 5